MAEPDPAGSDVGTSDAGRLPSRRDLKAAVLWCCRCLLGDGAVYAGPVRVTAEAAEDGEAITVSPVRGNDGLRRPELLGAAGGVAVPHAELLRVLLSDDERAILRALAESQPAKAATVKDRSRVEHSKFYVLWGNLQRRGFVADDEDEDRGYVLAVGWVRGLVEGGARPAA